LANVNNGVATTASASAFGVPPRSDVNVRRFESQELVDDDMIVDEHDTVLLIRATVVEIPARRDCLLVERSEEGLFDVVRDGHVILDGIKAAKDNIE
jgi:hypothetical protein